MSLVFEGPVSIKVPQKKKSKNNIGKLVKGSSHIYGKCMGLVTDESEDYLFVHWLGFPKLNFHTSVFVKETMKYFQENRDNEIIEI